uniref:Uncharacterized protein n=1 Tax=Anguilla anguilla TaxID=7936 RepID=A0A0E9WID0_ANGAN
MSMLQKHHFCCNGKALRSSTFAALPASIGSEAERGDWCVAEG